MKQANNYPNSLLRFNLGESVGRTFDVLTVEQMNEGVFLIDTFSKDEKAKINMHLARVQEILEESAPEKAIKKIQALAQ